MEYLTIILIALALLVVYLYNSLISKKNQVENMWGAIDTQLKKRYDLIPNIIESVKEYMDYENELFTKLTQIREQAQNAQDPQEISQANDALEGIISAINLRAEDYPELKASENFIHLQKTLANTEEEISASRRSYNQAVTDLNDAIEMFPSNLVNQLFLKLTKKAVLEIPDKQRENVDLKTMF